MGNYEALIRAHTLGKANSQTCDMWLLVFVDIGLVEVWLKRFQSYFRGWAWLAVNQSYCMYFCVIIT